MAKAYEELVGPIGRAVYFRPERRRVRELLSRDAEPSLRVGGKSFRLHDISLSGVSILPSLAEAAAFELGMELNVDVVVHTDVLFSGRARVARKEDGAGGTLVGIAVLNGLLDLHAFTERDEEGQLQQDFQGGADRLRDAVPGEYLHFLERAFGWVQFYRQSLARHEQRYRAKGPGCVDDLVARATDALRSQWWDIEHEGSEIASRIMEGPRALRAAKQYTELVLTPLLVNSPMFGRAYQKPRGYPGDYQTMMYCYENRPEGNSVFERVFHKLCVEHPLANGVRTRGRFVVGAIREEARRLAASTAGARLRVTSIGCGPAREVPELAQSKDGWAGHIHWSLMDQEEEALYLAYQAGTRALASSKSKGSLDCLHMSFAQFLADPRLFPVKEPQHLIYSVGLFDYLRERMAQGIVSALYEKLEPGGLLLVGNARGPNNHFWSLEFPTDWTLLYRTEDEMKRLARKLPSSAEVNVHLEPGEAYFFLAVRKPV